MREKKNYQVITFHTTSAAMAMERCCNANKIPGRLIPVPRELSAGCGLAWRMLPEEFTQLEAYLKKEPACVYRLVIGTYEIELEAIVPLLL